MRQITLANWCRDCHGRHYPDCIVAKDEILYHVEPSNLKILHPYSKDGLTEKIQSLRG